MKIIYLITVFCMTTSAASISGAQVTPEASTAKEAILKMKSQISDDENKYQVLSAALTEAKNRTSSSEQMLKITNGVKTLGFIGAWASGGLIFLNFNDHGPVMLKKSTATFWISGIAIAASVYLSRESSTDLLISRKDADDLSKKLDQARVNLDSEKADLDQALQSLN